IFSVRRLWIQSTPFPPSPLLHPPLLFPPTGTEKSPRDPARERGKEEDDVPNTAPFLLPLHPSCDGHSPVLRSPREKGVRQRPPSQCCHYDRVVRPASAQALPHPVSGASPLQHIQVRQTLSALHTLNQHKDTTTKSDIYSFLGEKNQPNCTDYVLGGIPTGEQSSFSFAFLPRLLPGLEEILLSQLQPSCVRTTLFEWRYLFKTQPVCLSIRLDGTPVPNRYMCSYHLPAKPLSGVCVYIHSGLSCLSDVDECSERQRCAQQCVNTAGSYRCACREGFALAGDGRSCQSLPPPSPPPATPTSSSQSSQATVGVSHHTDADGKFGLVENVTEEVQSLRNRVELLEKKLQLVLTPFSSFFPLSLDEGMSEKTTLLSHSFQQLDRIDSLSEQIGFLEERLGTCSCQEN
uniref:EGF-like domain-containing protein n=1 Tax=Astatotilapia calliptera TaxID=8154 RepID=A0A3P8RII9_ASTCA